MSEIDTSLRVKPADLKIVGAPEEPLLAAPRIVATSFLLTIFSILIRAITNDNGFGSTLFAVIPIQLYWAFCVNRLSQIVGRKCDSPPPLNQTVVALMTVASVLCFPRLDDFPFRYYLLDPTFIVWLAIQMVAPFLLGLTLTNKIVGGGTKNASLAYFLPFGLTLLANSYLLAFVVPAPAFITIMLIPAWAFAQFGVFSLLNLALRTVFVSDLNVVKSIKAQVAVTRLLSPEYPLAIPYRAFAGLQRWYKERFAGSTRKNSLKLTAASLLAPLLLIAALLFVFNSFVPATTAALTAPLVAASAAGGAAGTATAANAALAAATAAQNTFFIQAFLGTIGAFFLGVFFVYIYQPTHLLLGARGVKILWRHRLWWQFDVEMPWAQISGITYENPSEKRLFASKKIVLHHNGNPVKLDLSAIDSVDDKENLLQALQKWAPQVPRDSEIEQLLLPSSNHSYTELWLQALSAPPKRERLKPLLPGGQLRDGRYQIVNALGVGGQGSAYLVRDRVGGGDVVLKEFILPVFVNVDVRKSALEQFENEARILRQLDHDQIVKLVDFFIEDHRAYLVLEHIDGTSLRDLIEKTGAISEEKARGLAVQMCHILEYLHGLNPPVVHRDFTPDNLILRADGTLKLIDFNVAQQIEESTTGTVVGKHAYLPPEQFRGETTCRSDLYALGATLHYLLTGSDPEPISVSHPAEVVPTISAALNNAVAKATCMAEEERYQSAREIEIDLLR